MREELKRMALFGSGVAELTRNRAEQIARDLVKAGDIRRGHASDLVKELIDRSRENRKELVRVVRSEIKNQIEGLGLASKKDFERLERRITRLESGGGKKSAKKTTAKKATAKKTSAPRKTQPSTPEPS
jgi:polyhydroxyalkanoate synthesis regulator phasin